ncbi:BNR repeat-containing protein [Rhodopseudomonas sp. HC1]|uniref:BNR repeat-containing protein n=1 Tax=Rhodopseudomonas infernalis TaxID=2897386 RepID=UPI001EE8B5AE|nr:BNR repeat-containing protein [Rhodopseudomonas infernalis]MCG6203887.1 BNR repeat-containing protein [Rhodopseudomonas infernalis]
MTHTPATRLRFISRLTKKLTTQSVLIVGLFALLATSPLFARKVSAQSIVCAITSPTSHRGTAIYEIGKTWTGTRVFPGSAVTPQGELVVAYYDESRYLTIAALNLHTGSVCRRHLPSRFGGWDAHNTVSVAVSQDGVLHVTGNHHNSPLFYASGKSDNLSAIAVADMVGKEEDRVTYPTFLRDRTGRLAFLYRNGSSGAGTWYVNRWAGTKWVRVGAVFAEKDSIAQTSAYPSAFVADSQGITHVAVVWRRSPDLSSNFAISYVQTSDFQSWRGLSGAFKRGPVSPESGDVIDQPGPHSGLLNSAQLYLTPEGRPLILYLRYGEAGTDSLYLAYANNEAWQVLELASSKRRTLAVGGGTVSGLPVFSVAQSNWYLHVKLRFPPDEVRQFGIDLRSMTLSDTSVAARESQGASVPLPELPKGMAAPIHVRHPVLSSGFDGAVVGHLHWFAQTPNRDQSLPCTPAAPHACAPPPATLRFATPGINGWR